MQDGVLSYISVSVRPVESAHEHNNSIQGKSTILTTQVLRSLTHKCKRYAKLIFEHQAGFYFFHFLHRVTGDLTILPNLKHRRFAGQRDGTVIICPPGGGNIGDQALAESAAWNSRGRISMLVRNSSDYTLPLWLSSRQISIIETPHLLYGTSFLHFRDVWRFALLARRSESVKIIGADIMDGSYQPRASMLRWSIAALASSCGASASILGFSWNAAPIASSVAGLNFANKRVALWARDPVSYQRLQKWGATHVRQCADIVFAHPVRSLPGQFRELPESVEQQIRELNNYVIINASGLIGAEAHVIGEYRSIIRFFHNEGVPVILLPHVTRSASDIECLRLLHNMTCRKSVLVETLLTPAQIAELTSAALLVVTGRMHLAVLSAAMETPALTLSTQGKVEGLYELLERPHWALNSSSKFSLEVRNAYKEIVTTHARFPSEDASIKLRRLSVAPFTADHL